MDIKYLGHSSFYLKGKAATLVTDPYGKDWQELKYPKHITADIVTVSHEHHDHNAVENLEGEPLVIRGPGEYEVRGVGIVGLPTFHDEKNGAEKGKNTIFRIEMDKITIVHLGDLGHILNSAQVDELDGVDILLIPVGGTHTIDSKRAVEIVKELEPAMVIPMHYGRKEIPYLDRYEVFLKELGKENVVKQTKLTITKDKLPEEMQVVVLE